MNQQPSTEEYGKRGYLNTDFRIFHLKDTLKNEFEFHFHYKQGLRRPMGPT